MSIADELQKLETLRANGSLTEQEFALAKARVLGNAPPAAGAPMPAGDNVLQQFRRSRRDRWLGGVCGGLGEYTPVPSWAWRIGFLLLLLSFGFGILPYVLMWIFVPSEGEEE